MQLHRNGDRGIPYLKLSQTGAASSDAPIVMRPVRQIELDGNPLLNVRGNLYPIHLAGNGTFGFVHFNGYRFMRVYDAAGKKLWQVDNPSGRVHRDTIHRDTLAVLDADGDGDQDIVHCWAEGGKKVLMVRRGTDGAVLRRATLDNGSPNEECQIAAFRVPGRSTPLILVAATNRSGCATAGNYIDTWGRTLAFDVNLNLVWDRKTCAAGHYVYPVDDNADGYAGRIFIGKYLYEPDGTRVCTVDIGNTHADAVAVGDLDPGRPGVEAVVTGANGLKAVSVARNCAPIWSVPTGTIRNPQQLTLARLDASSATPTLALIERGSEPNATLFFSERQWPDPGPLRQERDPERPHHRDAVSKREPRREDRHRRADDQPRPGDRPERHAAPGHRLVLEPQGQQGQRVAPPPPGTSGRPTRWRWTWTATAATSWSPGAGA